MRDRPLARQERTCCSQNGRWPAEAEAFPGWRLFGLFLGAAIGGEIRSAGRPAGATTRKARLAITAPSIFNDAITREAFAHGLPLIDLRLLLDQDEDHANPIGPSVQGGAKLAGAIATLLTEHDLTRRRATVIAALQ